MALVNMTKHRVIDRLKREASDNLVRAKIKDGTLIIIGVTSKKRMPHKAWKVLTM